MEKQNEQLDPAIEALLLRKRYEELSAEEIALVELYLSAEQYRAFRKILLSAQALQEQESLLPAPKVHATLIAQFRHTHAKPGLWARLQAVLQHPIPSWQVGLACLMLCFGTYYWAGQNQISEQQLDGASPNKGNAGKVVLTSRSAEEEKELLVLLTGVK